MKAFFAKIWAWVLANKVLAAIIAGATVVVLTVAIVVPVSVSSAKKKKAAQEQQSQQQQPAGDQGGGGQQGGGEGAKSFTITWKDYAGNVLETDTNVKPGAMPTFDGEVPNKPSAYEDETYEAFKAWDKEVVAATADATYTATYEAKPYNGEFPKVNSTGTKVKYGLYPQHVIEPSALEDTLNDEINAGAPVLDTRYEYEGKYYLKTKVHDAQNERTYEGTTFPVTNDDELWFKCEPIEWSVLKNDTGRYHLFANIGLDNQQYFATNTANSNNYENSLIRNWLNNEFYNAAFSLGNKFIQVTTVDNSAASTGVAENENACENTNDKVYLLSAAELADGHEYGFTTEKRKITATDYTLAHGGYLDNNNHRNTAWWTRSPREYTGNGLDNRRVKGVTNAGNIDVGFANNFESIAPAIQITLN